MYKYIQLGKTPLHYVSDKHPDMVDLLIEKGADRNAKDEVWIC
jgi:hypothetical protein